MIIVTGANGFVGARVMQQFREAIAMPSSLYRGKDLEDPENIKALENWILSKDPTLIIHTAAISDIGDCEKDPEGSRMANIILPMEIAKTAKKTGAKLLCFSSDQVYTGCTEEGPYKETDILPQPANTYAIHKLEMENRVLDLLPESVMLRAEWMYDMPVHRPTTGHPNRGNLMALVMKAAMRNEKLGFSKVQYRGVTYVRQVAELLEKMAKAPGGVYNYGSENDLNMADTVERMCEILNIPSVVERNDRPGHDLWIDASKARSVGADFDSVVDGFKRIKEDYGF